MIILAPIETSSRELLSKFHLCQELSSIGYTCYVGSKSYINYLAVCLDNVIYLDKGYHSGKSDILFNRIRKNNGKIISLDEEGAVDYSDSSTLLNVRYPKSLKSKVDHFFLWGQYQYDLLKSERHLHDSSFVTGHPRFELLKSSYHAYYSQSVEDIKRNYEDFILINTNTAFSNNKDGGEDYVSESYYSRFKNIAEIIAFDREKFDAIIHIVKLLSEKTDDEIIIRPHPEENIETYQNIFRENNKIRVIRKNSVIPWILASKYMLHSDCTTGIESLFLGKKSISFLPEKKSILIADLPLKASLSFEEDSNLIDFINSDQGTNVMESSKSSAKFLDDYFSFKSNAINIISNKIKELYPPVSVKKLRFQNSLFLKIKSLRSHFKRQFAPQDKLEGLNYLNLKELQSVCSEIEPKFALNRLSKISKKLFLISN